MAAILQTTFSNTFLQILWKFDPKGPIDSNPMLA